MGDFLKAYIQLEAKDRGKNCQSKRTSAFKTNVAFSLVKANF